MSDITFAIEAKSDQLNAVDIIAADRVIRIRKVEVKAGDQPVSVFFDGDNNKPWKPSKGMLRAMSVAWGTDSSNWIGKFARLYHDESVIYAGKQVGGIRVSELSDIPEKGIHLSETISRNKRRPIHIKRLMVNMAPYPDENFKRALPTMVKKMQSGEMSLQQVIAQCQQTGQLSEIQHKILEDAAPVDIQE
jgi:hypothetical protein